MAKLLTTVTKFHIQENIISVKKRERKLYSLVTGRHNLYTQVYASHLSDVYILQVCLLPPCTCFGSTYTKIGTIQRRLAWPLRKDDTQNREAFLLFYYNQYIVFNL